MPTLRTLAHITLIVAVIGQLALLWLQLDALRKYKHRSFVALALGTSLGLIFSTIELVVLFAPAAAPSIRQLYYVGMVIGIVQIPVAIWATAWLFRSYGQMYLRK